MIPTPALDSVERILKDLLDNDTAEYHVPGLWIGESGDRVVSSAPAYFLRQIASIRSSIAGPVAMPLVYNALIRHVTSYNHGKPAREAGWRTMGTFLKLLGFYTKLFNHFGFNFL